ncbi:hypothetical protein B296_00028586 [Ensete ventricosum]|uniref:Uncharacterized protein n=1 Tax=Ensete ventricosum TaxID=4639 RepID=A0A426Y8M5_ENSVE|nr:hypothetical protein B296_00028586 [Ensete ventricosum]
MPYDHPSRDYRIRRIFGASPCIAIAHHDIVGPADTSMLPGYRYKRPPWPWVIAPCSLIAPTKGLTALTDGLATPVGGLAMGGHRCRQPACMWPPPMPIAKTARRRSGQPPCRAGHPQPGRGQGQPEREGSDACKQKHRPRGSSRLHAQSTATSPGRRPWPTLQSVRARRLPTGKGNCRLHRGSDDGDDTKGEEGRLQRMVMRRSDGTDDDEINNHRVWRGVNAHIDPIVSD